MKQMIKEITPQVHSAVAALIAAVDAHVAGDQDAAAAQFRKANCPDTWAWLNDAWIVPRKNIVVLKPEGDSKPVPKAERDPDRNIHKSIKEAVLERDGYRCRYCGLPVVSAEIRKIAHRLYPQEIPWMSSIPAEQHSAFQVTWLQYDHVVPHSHGGRSSEDNVVISCALCNFGKDGFTLRQLDLEDPRLREPIPTSFDGLERLRGSASHFVPEKRATSMDSSRKPEEPTSAGEGSGLTSFFFPGAWVSLGYAYTPPVSGKERWFKLGDLVEAVEISVNGVRGAIVSCPLDMVVRRGIDAEHYRIHCASVV